jgi:hypothetical protein
VRSFDELTNEFGGIEGFEDAYLLVDHDGGKAMTVTLWSSEVAAEASAERASQMRSDAVAASGFSIGTVETYEVALHLRG